MPYVVAITGAPQAFVSGGYRAQSDAVSVPVSEWLGPVATLLGMLPFDLRQRLAGAPPWIVARTAEAAEARTIGGALRAAGVGAVVLDLADPTLAPSEALTSRAFAHEAGVLLEPQGGLVPYDALALVVRASLEEELGVEVTERAARSRFSRGTGEKVTTHSRSRARTHALYLCIDRGPTVRLVEGRFAFPDEVGPTARSRLDAFVAKLRAAIDEARYHDAFVSAPRKRTTLRAITQGETHRSTVQGNLAETDLAVALLVRAHEERAR